jgi:hypothetical protein
MIPRRFMALGAFVLALVFSSQTLSSTAVWAAEASLYERLGGTYPIAVVVDDFMNRELIKPGQPLRKNSAERGNSRPASAITSRYRLLS